MVRLGEPNLSPSDDSKKKSSEHRKISRVTIHPKYNNGQAYFDIALLDVDEIKFSPTVRPVCLPNSKDFKTEKYDNVIIDIKFI
jgi:hypothetical protein